MAKTKAKQNKTEGRRISAVPILLPLVVILLLAAVVSELRRPAEKVPEYVEVNDGVNQVTITPAEGVAASRLSEEDFRETDGVVTYTGTAHTARQGIDVSEYQETIDWTQVAGDGVEFAVLRLGYRGSTEGLLNTDACFEENYRGAREAGLDVGVYFFSQAADEQEAVAEADYVLQVLDGRELDLPVIFDWEAVEVEGARTAGVDGGTVSDCAAAFCRRITAARYGAGIYFNRQQGYYDYDLAALGDYMLWVSDPNCWTDFYYAVSLWQYSFTGRVAGITGNVDRNMLFE